MSALRGIRRAWARLGSGGFTLAEALVDSIVQAVNNSALIGMLYDIESVASDGSTIWARVLLTPSGDIVILSWTDN
jgi:hypothetical protein